MLTELSVPVPPNLPSALGYTGQARCVGLYWTPHGDTVCWDDGRATDAGRPWAWQAWARHRAVAPVLAPYNLGSGDEEAAYWLVLDLVSILRAFVAPARYAEHYLRARWPARTVPGRAEQAAILDACERGWCDVAGPSPHEIRARMAREAEEVRDLVAWLDLRVIEEGANALQAAARMEVTR